MAQTTTADLIEFERISQRPTGFKAFLHLFFKVRLTPVGTAILVFLVAVAILAPLISPFDPADQDLYNTLAPPTLFHPFGADHLGRDILSRIIWGARVSLSVGLVSVAISCGFGTPLGLISGFFGGKVDNIIMRLTEVLQAFPPLVLALSITAALGPSIYNVIMAIGIVIIPSYARLVRGTTLSLKEREFIEAARTVGSSSWRIIFRHILPNCLAPVIVVAFLSVSFSILSEAGMSFLGLGVQPPTPSWGGMLRIGYSYMEIAPWLSVFPGLAILVTVMALNFVGDGVRDATDPRLHR